LVPNVARSLPTFGPPSAPTASASAVFNFGPFRVDAGKLALGFANANAPAATDNASRPNFEVPKPPPESLRPSMSAGAPGLSFPDRNINPFALFNGGNIFNVNPTATFRLSPVSNVAVNAPVSVGAQGNVSVDRPTIRLTQGLGAAGQDAPVFSATLPQMNPANFSASLALPFPGGRDGRINVGYERNSEELGQNAFSAGFDLRF
jgi:hypothetical protein